MLIVKEIMNPNVYSLPSNTILRKVARVMRDKKVGCIIVKKNGELVGVVTEVDIVRKGIAENLDMDLTKMEDIMSAPLITIDSNKTVTDANEIMDKNGTRHLAVKEGREIIGIISARDLIHPPYLDGEGW